MWQVGIHEPSPPARLQQVAASDAVVPYRYPVSKNAATQRYLIDGRVDMHPEHGKVQVQGARAGGSTKRRRPLFR